MTTNRRASVRYRGMNMRDMKQRSMSRHSSGGARSSPTTAAGDSAIVTRSEDAEDPFDEAIHVDQGDGSYASQGHYDGGGEGDYATLPDSPPDGWWD